MHHAENLHHPLLSDSQYYLVTGQIYTHSTKAMKKSELCFSPSNHLLAPVALTGQVPLKKQVLDRNNGEMRRRPQSHRFRIIKEDPKKVSAILIDTTGLHFAC